MRSFFFERFNRVKLNGKISTWEHVKMGRPQGSSFGPLLWNLFQNDLSYEVSDDALYMYADDHQIYKVGKQLQNVQNHLMKEAELASSWYKENLLQTNTKKYQILTITSVKYATPKPNPHKSQAGLLQNLSRPSTTNLLSYSLALL
jgi:hypothetical protein